MGEVTGCRIFEGHVERQAGLLARSQLLECEAWVGGQAGAGDHGSRQEGGWEEGSNTSELRSVSRQLQHKKKGREREGGREQGREGRRKKERKKERKGEERRKAAPSVRFLCEKKLCEVFLLEGK